MLAEAVIGRCTLIQYFPSSDELDFFCLKIGKCSGWGFDGIGNRNGRCTLILTFPALMSWIFFA